MNKIMITIGFVVMLLAQWFVPGQMIFEQEDVLGTGTAYKFRTQPIDPNDPFRGKFIVLNYEMNQVTHADSLLTWRDPIYVYIANDSLGYAKATHASSTLLDTDQDYVMATVNSNYNGTLHFDLPFNKHFMNEDKAYDAERAVWDINRNRDSVPSVCYGRVFVKEGVAILDDVFIDDISIQKYVEQEQKE